MPLILYNADWSIDPKGRWVARAERREDHWIAAAPTCVREPGRLLDALFELAVKGTVVAGFDFPIGVPVAYGRQTGLGSFPALLDKLGTGDWSEFFAVAKHRAEIGINRPFYPHAPGGKRLFHLIEQLGVPSIDVITRDCEKGSDSKPSAGCMFWTLGAKQVGKAALHGWQHVVCPAKRRGAKLWPFDGDLPSPETPGLVIVESYPGDAYRQVGFSFRGKAKTKQVHRQAFAEILLSWCDQHTVRVDDDLSAAMAEGFAERHGNDNGFDAVVGLLAMIGVLQGCRPAGAPASPAVRTWEGWIFGRHA